MKLSFTVNGQLQTVDVEPDTPLLWVIRDHLNLTGTKFGCGIAQCGACTVHLNGTPVRSCMMPASGIQNQNITTIEGVTESKLSAESQAITNAWEELAVVQCGYCQSGQIMSATALLKQNPKPTDKDIDNYMSGNICRCNTYVRIKKAIKLASDNLAIASVDSPIFYDASKVASSNHTATEAEGETHHGA